MKLTDERVIPKLMNPRSGILQEHIFRYEFAKQFCHGKVLDIACGVGYGSEIILENNPRVRELVGIDNSPEAVDYANKHYGFPQASYFVDDAINPNLPTIYGQFDTILSFETVEHFEGDELFVQNLYNLLQPDGTLIISTPFGQGKGKPCASPFHVYQYKEEEFWEVLQPFQSITMYHQLDTTIEIPEKDKKYYLMVAVCQK